METLTFESSRELRSWLAKNHDKSPGVWLRIYKKGAKITSVTYAEALDQALCYGWIDGQKRPHDRESWLQKFSPRRPKSGWSKINTRHAERLIESGDMAPAGMKAIEAAKLDGRWDAAYDSPAAATVPEDFLKELRKNDKALAFFETLNKTNLFSITYRLQTAKKPETRARRMKEILAMLAEGKKFRG